MKLFTMLTMTLLISLSCAHKEKKTTSYEVMKNTEKETAEVTDIDYKTRKLTMKTDEGPVTITAPAEVKNFEQIKKGDTVVAEYQEALAYYIDKGGNPQSDKESSDYHANKIGEMPGAEAKSEVTASLTVTDINKKEKEVTLKNAAGESQTFDVAHPERLDDLNLGDVVNVKYSEAMVIKVEKKQI